MPQGPFAPTLLPRLHRSWPHPTPPGVETASVFTLCRSLRWLPAHREVSRVQRVPLDACHPCNPGGARRCIRHRASRRVLSSPVRERLDLLGASRGYMRVHFCYGPRPRSSRASAGTSRSYTAGELHASMTFHMVSLLPFTGNTVLSRRTPDSRRRRETNMYNTDASNSDLERATEAPSRQAALACG